MFAAKPLVQQDVTRGTVFPEHTHAIIYRPGRSATTSGKRRTREWKLRFERQTSPFVEPLMGWTGGEDPLANLELSFPSVESAIAYARRHGLSYSLQGGSHDTLQDTAQNKPQVRIVARTAEAERAAAAHRRRMEWVERRLGPDVIRDGFGPGSDPAAAYPSPQHVLRQENLSQEQKRDLLLRWVLDAYLLDLAFSKHAQQPEGSRLQEVIDALVELDRASTTTIMRRDPLRGSG